MAILKNTEIIGINYGDILSLKNENNETKLSVDSDSVKILTTPSRSTDYSCDIKIEYVASVTGGGGVGGNQDYLTWSNTSFSINEVILSGDEITVTSPVGEILDDYATDPNKIMYFSMILDYTDNTTYTVAPKIATVTEMGAENYYYLIDYTLTKDVKKVSFKNENLDKRQFNSKYYDGKDVINRITVTRNGKNIAIKSDSPNSSLEIGYNSDSAKYNGIAIGNNSKTSNGIAIGTGAKTYVGTNIGAGDRRSDLPNALCLGVGNNLYAYITGRIDEITKTSDMRDKIDFIDITKGLEFISKLKPVTYRANVREDYIDENGNMDNDAYKNGELSGNRRHAGFKAQEVYETLKEVYGNDNYAKIVDYSKYDHPDSSVDRYYISMSSMIPFLVKAIQEQQDEINELKKLINELKK